jgi:hypothetical protein
MKYGRTTIEANETDATLSPVSGSVDPDSSIGDDREIDSFFYYFDSFELEENNNHNPFVLTTFNSN